MRGRIIVISLPRHLQICPWSQKKKNRYILTKTLNKKEVVIFIWHSVIGESCSRDFYMAYRHWRVMLPWFLYGLASLAGHAPCLLCFYSTEEPMPSLCSVASGTSTYQKYKWRFASSWQVSFLPLCNSWYNPTHLCCGIFRKATTIFLYRGGLGFSLCS
jgi:hypothetical protein